MGILPVNKRKSVRLKNWVRTKSERRYIPHTGNRVYEDLGAGGYIGQTGQKSQ